ncbi:MULTISPECIES: tRNA (adenosine(37)-N6)-threonylcarbamoyltransferase complex ATPase subunit type 1 TsaE [Xanthomonas]|uniref:tRNA threonylcarbamoyladenosine biosynthesis protein TsaE n=2 Tax=Xanthomonas phaseoli TaxID=1985254 RepID=A0AB34QHT6_XANCH|nr:MULTISPECIES: tRNA (adenosine(37)-N6)-threonylcarbamoyltransferase complex ATPase subunit type 1 TsaE [Xanthomonas]ATS21593.1 tRNA (adenosine(37)-N6)-threonylcarbamoyltransferase complex ATPase subunit type 1 TsaE [Xanthomonas phaseoli pv. phaseoli]ATS24398.1 tRNA (adenosine(37)-N6)-threonylcarbamoyltransferase complex ATPase subunit type 1 TsaE [Xanthomonas phaseoli pv. phaseoli]ATS28626.1 tRNA (adenosine(37)-N6)-threonylcarbamoyltransferase complex ATPase subunit type 1 TsaE [Xanthomonas ph
MIDLNGQLHDVQATETLGQALAAVRPASAVVQLHGDLGAGKSTLARALLRALGVTGPIRSPTYTLVERYPLATGDEAWHLDLYRIGHAGELDFLGLDEGSASLWLVEWPERGAGVLPPVDLDVELAVAGEGRSVRLLGRSAIGHAWMESLSQQPQLQALFASSREE